MVRKGSSHLIAVSSSLGDLPSSSSLRMTGYLAGLVGSTTPGGVADAAMVVSIDARLGQVVVEVEGEAEGLPHCPQQYRRLAKVTRTGVGKESYVVEVRGER